MTSAQQSPFPASSYRDRQWLGEERCHLQSSQVAYRKERLRWLSAGARERGDVEGWKCVHRLLTRPRKVVLWAVGSKVARGAFPAQVSRMLAVIRCCPVARTPKLGAAVGGGQAGAESRSGHSTWTWRQVVCVRGDVYHTLPFPYRNGRVKQAVRFSKQALLPSDVGLRGWRACAWCTVSRGGSAWPLAVLACSHLPVLCSLCSPR